MYRRRVVVVAVVTIAVIGYASWVAYVRLCGPHVQDNKLVGRTEFEIRRSYGETVADEPGYQSIGKYTPPMLPPGPIRTLKFFPRGLLHPEGGTLVVWITEQKGNWVCFESIWYADGVQF